jgi:hypothetical protein
MMPGPQLRVHGARGSLDTVLVDAVGPPLLARGIPFHFSRRILGGPHIAVDLPSLQAPSEELDRLSREIGRLARGVHPSRDLPTDSLEPWGLTRALYEESVRSEGHPLDSAWPLVPPGEIRLGHGRDDFAESLHRTYRDRYAAWRVEQSRRSLSVLDDRGLPMSLSKVAVTAIALYHAKVPFIGDERPYIALKSHSQAMREQPDGRFERRVHELLPRVRGDMEDRLRRITSGEVGEEPEERVAVDLVEGILAVVAAEPARTSTYPFASAPVRDDSPTGLSSWHEGFDDAWTREIGVTTEFALFRLGVNMLYQALDRLGLAADRRFLVCALLWETIRSGNHE